MNEKAEPIATAPVAGWTIAPVSAYRAVMLGLDYLSHAGQAHDQAHQSPQYILTVPQALELAAALTKHAALASSGGPEGAGLPKH